MKDLKIQRRYQESDWTKPRRLEVGILVAFPPEEVMETPLPSQVQKSKALPLQDILDLAIVAIATSVTLVIAIIISPLFIKALIQRYQNFHS